MQDNNAEQEKIITGVELLRDAEHFNWPKDLLKFSLVDDGGDNRDKVALALQCAFSYENKYELDPSILGNDCYRLFGYNEQVSAPNAVSIYYLPDNIIYRHTVNFKACLHELMTPEAIGQIDAIGNSLLRNANKIIGRATDALAGERKITGRGI